MVEKTEGLVRYGKHPQPNALTTYADWCHETGEKYPLDWKVVAERLRRLGCTRKRNRTDERGNPNSKGTPKEGWLGISVRLPGEVPFGISQ